MKRTASAVRKTSRRFLEGKRLNHSSSVPAVIALTLIMVVLIPGYSRADVCVFFTEYKIERQTPPMVNELVIFDPQARNNCGSGDVYYRVDFIPNYGTADYDPFNNFQTVQDFSLTGRLDHTFDQTGNWIGVVWASDTPYFSTPSAQPMAGGSIAVVPSGTDCSILLYKLEIAGMWTAPQVGDLVTIKATAGSGCGETIYYRFDLVPNYGTAEYDPNNNFQTLQDYSPDSEVNHVFRAAGSYIIHVWASNTRTVFTGSAPPRIGMSVTVEEGEASGEGGTGGGGG
jgi:hypothetical protein